MKRTVLSAAAFGLVAWLVSGVALAELSLDQFLGKAFPSAKPEIKMLWLTPPLKQRAAAILEHEYPGLRVKYWQAGPRTAWVLDEIGKERPITVGVVVEQGRIEAVEVMAFRESRGGEVQHGFFTRQFEQAGLKADDKLGKNIDGITGATLSVAAVTKVSRLALAFDQAVNTAK